MLSGFSQSRTEKTFSAWRQTDTTSEEKSDGQKSD